MILRKIFNDNKYTQKLVLEVGVPHIYLEKLVPEAEATKEAPITFHDAIRSKPMEEYSSDKEEEQTGVQTLWDMFKLVSAEGYEVSHVAIGDKRQFQQWLDIRIPVTNLMFFGTPIEIVPEIPSDVVLVCGASTRDAEPADIQFSVKVSIT